MSTPSRTSAIHAWFHVDNSVPCPPRQLNRGPCLHRSRAVPTVVTRTTISSSPPVSRSQSRTAYLRRRRGSSGSHTQLPRGASDGTGWSRLSTIQSSVGPKQIRVAPPRSLRRGLLVTAPRLIRTATSSRHRCPPLWRLFTEPRRCSLRSRHHVEDLEYKWSRHRSS